MAFLKKEPKLCFVFVDLPEWFGALECTHIQYVD